MYLFLLGFGALMGLAGVILAASGLSISDHSFDAGLMTPGIVAVVGGLLLIGLGFALQILQRIERALEARSNVPAPAVAGTALVGAALAGTALAGTAPDAVSASDPLNEMPRASFPVRSARTPQTNTPAESARVPEKRVEEVSLKFLKTPRVGATPPAEEIEAPSASEEAPDADKTAAQNAAPLFSRGLRARNGAAPAGRISPRADSGTRAALGTRRPTGPAFDALWPKGTRRGAAQAQPAPEIPARAEPPFVHELRESAVQESGVQEPSIQEPVAQQHLAQEPVPHEQASDSVLPESAQAVAHSRAVAPQVEPLEEAEPVTVLKSGIVDGMAYTLYSDGSIEAQLPQGLLRFGSISELRAHIEQDTANP